jgi:hypothetical protein
MAQNLATHSRASFNEQPSHRTAAHFRPSAHSSPESHLAIVIVGQCTLICSSKTPNSKCPSQSPTRLWLLSECLFRPFPEEGFACLSQAGDSQKQPIHATPHNTTQIIVQAAAFRLVALCSSNLRSSNQRPLAANTPHRTAPAMRVPIYLTICLGKQHRRRSESDYLSWPTAPTPQRI